MNTRATISRARARLRTPGWARLLAAALVAIGFQCPGTSHAGCHIQSLELPVKMVGNRAIATVGIGGTQVPLVVDTGAFFSMLTEAAAAQLNLKVVPLPRRMKVDDLTGQIDARMTSVPRLRLLKGDMHDVDFIVGGNEMGSGTMGLLGRNLLAVTDTEYDLAHGVVRLVFPSDDCEKANMAYWASPDTPVSELALARQFPARMPAIRTTIELNGHKMIAVFDSGARTLVSLDAAHRAGVADLDMTPDGQAYGLGTVQVKQWIAKFDKVDFGGEAIEHNRLEVVDYDMSQDMLLGIDFFLAHHIYVSQQQSRMFFTYEGGPVFALNHGDRSDHDAGGAGTDSPTADDLARRGAAALSRGDLAGALADLDRACALAPVNADFLATRAAIHLAQGHPDKALADLDTALRLDSTQDRARVERAAIHGAQGERDKALEDLAALDRRLAPQSEIRRAMASLYDEFGMPARALAQWNLWIADHPHDIGLAAAYDSRCRERTELGTDLDKALADCDEAIDADGKNAAFLDSRAWVYLRMGKPQKALADFNRGLAIKADGASSLYGRGLVHLALGEASAAQADLAAARKVQPDIDDSVRKSGLPRAPEAPAAKP